MPEPWNFLCSPNNRRHVISMVLTMTGVALLPSSSSISLASDGVAEKFDLLSKNGNSNCSKNFLESITQMSAGTRLQGSCCTELNLHRFREQVEGLKAFSHFPEIPPDPYDVEMGLAGRLLVAYDMELTTPQLAIYSAALEKSDEGGPCCCKCWRWHVFGGLGKLLIRDRDFDADQVARVWNLSDDCGGDSHAH